MKLYRKLIAVLLAGVVALTVLTGCKTAAPKTAEDKYAEYIAIMNDCLKSGQDMGNLTDAKAFKRDTGINTMAQSAAEFLRTEFEKGDTDIYVDEDTKAELQKRLITNSKDTNIYMIACEKINSYESAYFNGRKQYELVQAMLNNMTELYDAKDAGYYMAEDAIVLTGFAEIKVKDDNYIVVVMQIPTELQA